MPQIFPKNIVSFSSEDKEFPASNLLKTSSFNKWRSAKGGTLREVVELDFGEPVEVSRLDIGNNGSAFIEVLVRRSASSDDPVVFVPCSSFMSPMDAKNETNLTRVRVFSGDQLYDVAAKQKWDIFRLVCTQPFNKSLSYGISFVSFHSPAPRNQPSSNGANTAGDSVLPLDDEIENDSPDFRPGALFQASKANPSPAPTSASRPTTVAEKLRAANQSASCSQSADSTTTAATSTSSGHSVNPTVRKSVVQPSLSQQAPKPGRPSVMSSNRSDPVSPQPSASDEQPTSTGRSSNQSRTSHPPQPSTSTTPSSSRHPLAGVVFSLSGYQNPLRSELRQKALALGAKFRQDWGRDCTHLICAFPNTPKFKEVSGKGIIVSDKWIIKCHETKSMVNWRPYRVGRAPSPPNQPSSSTSQPSTTTPTTQSHNESEGESSEGSPKPKSANKLRKRARAKDEDDDWQPTGDDEAQDEEEEEEEDQDDDYENEEDKDESEYDEEDEDEDDDDDSSARKRTTSRRSKTGQSVKKNKRNQSRTPPPIKKAKTQSSKPSNPEDEDTDDEIQRVMNPSPVKDDDNSPISQTAQSPDRSEGLPELPNLFEKAHFFIHAKAIPSDEERMIKRLIVAFAGTLHPYMHPDVQFVVTRSKWNEEFDETLANNPNLIFVRPDWIFACDEQAKRVPFQKYLVVG